MEIINGLGYKDPSLAASYIEIVFLNIFQVHAHSKLKSLMIIMKVTINSYYFVSFKKKILSLVRWQCVRNLTIHMEKMGIRYSNSLNEIYSKQIQRQVYNDIVTMGKVRSHLLSRSRSLVHSYRSLIIFFRAAR